MSYLSLGALCLCTWQIEYWKLNIFPKKIYSHYWHSQRVRINRCILIIRYMYSSIHMFGDKEPASEMIRRCIAPHLPLGIFSFHPTALHSHVFLPCKCKAQPPPTTNMWACSHKMLNPYIQIYLSYMRKTSSVAGLAIWAKKNWRKIWPKNGLKWPNIA